MLIAVDATCWNLRRGFGRATRCLLKALVELPQPHRYCFVTDDPMFQEALPSRVEVLRTESGQRTIESAAEGRRRSLLDMWQLGRALSSSRFDRVLFPTVFSFVPTWTGATRLVMMHDVTAELYPGQTFGSWKDRLLWSLKMRLARRQAARILTISEHSRMGLIRRFRLSPARVRIVPGAADPVFRVLNSATLGPALKRRGVRDDRRLLTYVGGFAPLKNVPALVETFFALCSRHPEADLVLVGEDREETFYSTVSVLKERIEALGLGGRVHFTGFLPDQELVHLLNRSTVLILPSLNEGLGLPALEAAACGCPVIATTSSPLPGLLGEGGLYVNPHRPRELESALERLLGDERLRLRMREEGLNASRRLSWSAAAQTLLELLEQ